MKLKYLFLTCMSFYAGYVISIDKAPAEAIQVLFNAIEQKNKKEVQRLLTEGVDVNSKNNKGQTPLMCAIEMIAPKIVKALLAKNADINAQDPDGNTALMLALIPKNDYWGHDVKIIEYLFKAKPDMNIKNKEGLTALLWAAKDGPFELNRFIEAGADATICDNKGWTAIMYIICSKGFEETNQWFVPLVTDLVKAGVDIHAYNNEGMNALMLATKYQNEVIELLVNFCEASINAKNSEGITALMTAAEYNPYAIPLLLKLGAHSTMQNNKGETALNIAMKYNVGALQPLLAFSDDPSSIDFFIKENININTQNAEGINQLMSAVRWNPAAVKNLLQAGADINAKNKIGETALMIAARYNAEAIPLLIANGANMEYEIHDCDYKNNALTIAVRYNTEAVKHLLAAGANIKVYGSYYTTRNLLSDDLLGLAIAFNPDALELLLQAFTKVKTDDEFGTHALKVAIKYKPEFITPLLKAGADVNAKKDEYSSYACNDYDTFLTPLMIAAQCATDQEITILVEGGAHLEEKDKEGCTALFYAINKGKKENSAKLIELGANVNHQNKEGYTPLMKALDFCFENNEIIPMLLTAGADISLHNEHGQTALTLAHLNRDTYHVTLLQDFIDKNHSRVL